MGSTYIIAEAGVNHNGSLELAKQLIDQASQAGANAIKFQTFKAERLASRTAPKAGYQQQTTGNQENQFEMLKRLELSESAHRDLAAYCKDRRIEFLSTPFDLESVDFLAHELKLPRIKIPSGEITHGPYLLKIARYGLPVILSTGMSSLEEIRSALAVIAFGYLNASGNPTPSWLDGALQDPRAREALKNKVVLLHCTTEYPAPFPDVNLRAMESMKEAFGLPVGYSDHTSGIAVPIAAVALGATVIEKHFTSDRNLPGPDHKASLEPHELTEMVKSIRNIEQALGDGVKRPVSSEIHNRTVVRKSIVASRPIRKGESFMDDNLICKRPEGGISPMRYWECIGKVAKRDFQPDEPIEL